MKKLICFLLIISVVIVSCKNTSSDVSTSLSDGIPQLNETNIDAVVAAMTLEEKANLLVGAGMGSMMLTAPVVGSTDVLVPGAAGTTRAIPRLGIPSIVVADGPAGLRISPTRAETEKTFYCTAFPIGTLLSSTWDTDLIFQVGQAMGNEVLEYGVDVILGPGMNIHRNPLCGRNFEYYSEDPLLAGKIGSSIVNGIESNGVGTSIKHFAANSQETNRNRNDVIISERVLREIYLKGFEIAVKEAQPWTIMTSYNKINGLYTSEDRWLLTDIARDEWGYEGMVMTDWGGGSDVAAQIYAGNDLIMPGSDRQVETIIAAVNDGTLSMNDVDVDVKRILQLIVKTPRFKGYQYSNNPDLQKHAQVTRQSAAEGMVLLKNDGTLPFAKNIVSIAAFGNFSYKFIVGGTGSGDVNEAYTISLGEGLSNAGYKLDESLPKIYTDYLDKYAASHKDVGGIASLLNPVAPAPELLIADNVIKKAIDGADIVVMTVGRNSGEGRDRKEADDFLLSDVEKEMMTKVADIAHQQNKKFVVILNVGGVIETASWKNIPDAILLAWQGGQEGGNSVADILKGNVNPSGKLPMTFPINLSDHPSTANFPTDGMEMGGRPAQNNQNRPNIDYTNYSEGVYVGYRAFEHFSTPVSYPFGYGLSYTDFSYSNFSIAEKKGVYTVTCEVTNTGSVAGKEVVELYVDAPEGLLEKPEKELKAFAKTKLLQPGETQTITMTFDRESVASFNEDLGQWVVDKGEYQILIGASSADVKGGLKFNIKKEIKFI